MDPFFHYHAPLEGWYYELGDQRSQNDGITRHFSYDAVITGTSMAENFKTSQFDSLFGTSSVKVTYPGATYKEINDNLDKAFATHDNIRYVLRGLDYSHLIEGKDEMRTDMGDYPTYLYDRNPFNDIKYLYNSTVLGVYIVPMLRRRLSGGAGGMTDFDDYGWSGDAEYSADAALHDTKSSSFTAADEQRSLTEDEEKTLRDNVEQNIVRTAKEHPDTTFLYFFTPYSALWWGSLWQEGTMERQIEAEQIATKMMLKCDNIRVFSFNMETEIITNLDNYKDAGHYSPQISEWILDRIKQGRDEITYDSAALYAQRQRDFYMNFDYNSLFEQGSK